jgi:hypothetical protein
VQKLASFPVDAIAILVKVFAFFGFVIDGKVSFESNFIVSVSESTLILLKKWLL